MYTLGIAVKNLQENTMTFFRESYTAIKRAQDVASRLLFCETPRQQGYSEPSEFKIDVSHRSKMDFTPYIKTTPDSASRNKFMPTVPELEDSIDKLFNHIDNAVDSTFGVINENLDDFNAKHAETKELIADIIDLETSTDQRIFKLGSLCDDAITSICAPPLDTFCGLAGALIDLLDGDISDATQKINTTAKFTFNTNNDDLVGGVKKDIQALVSVFDGFTK